VTGKGDTVLRGGAGLVYETINWEALLAFNNAFGLNNVPTGAIIDAAGDTAGGTITASNISVPPVMPQWDGGTPIYGANVSTATPTTPPSKSVVKTTGSNLRRVRWGGEETVGMGH